MYTNTLGVLGFTNLRPPELIFGMWEYLSLSLSYFRDTKCLVKANNNRKAVVVCAIDVVKRPSMRIALVSILLKRD